jgi:hypothetical protein
MFWLTPNADVLAQFKRVAWNHNLIYPESFYESYRAFFDTPPEKQRSTFVALLLVVLCVGLGNMAPERAVRERICKDLGHWKRRCLAFWRGCQRALAASNIIRVRELEVIQTLVMMMYCNQSLDDNGCVSSHTLGCVTNDLLLLDGSTILPLSVSPCASPTVSDSQNSAQNPWARSLRPAFASASSSGASGGTSSSSTGTSPPPADTRTSSTPRNALPVSRPTRTGTSCAMGGGLSRGRGRCILGRRF